MQRAPDFTRMRTARDMASSDDTESFYRDVTTNRQHAARSSCSPSSRDRLAWLMRHAEQDFPAGSSAMWAQEERGREVRQSRIPPTDKEESSRTSTRMRPESSQLKPEGSRFASDLIRPRAQWPTAIASGHRDHFHDLDSPASNRSWSTTGSTPIPVAWHPSEDRQASDSSSVSSNKSVAGSNANQVDDEEMADSEQIETVTISKTSRYLREMDRRAILERLQRGEKQSALAKEFMVSRAAICNLNKHRHEVLARSSENPFAKHPKKKKKKLALHQRAKNGADASRPPSASTLSTLSGSSTAVSSLGVVNRSAHVAGTLQVIRSKALQLLLSAMNDQTGSLADFRRTSERVLWLLMEEALAFVPVEQRENESTLPSLTVASPPSAVSMEHQAMGASPMLDIFQLMEPTQPVGTATVMTDRHTNLCVDVANLDESLRGYNVFLLNVVAASGEAVRATIEQLIQRFGAAEDCISVVSLFTSSEVVAMVQCKYPRARIVTARIDSNITRRRVASTAVDLILHRMRQAYSSVGSHV